MPDTDLVRADAEDADLAYPNGVDAETGEYLLPPLPPETICRFAEARPVDRKELGALRSAGRTEEETMLGVVSGVEANDVAQAGWGVLFSRDSPREVQAALQPLLDLRRSQAGTLYYEFSGPSGYVPGTGAFEWRRVGPYPARPQVLPYYILLVGDAHEIPFEFQYQLDVIHAVGRICFDTVEEYAAYARAVVHAEGGAPRRERTLGFFAPRNPGDVATQMSSELLVRRLALDLAGAHADWRVSASIGPDATKPTLARMLGGKDTPAVLFTASHGIRFSPDNPVQRSRQGALLCQEWPGRANTRAPVPPEQYFSAEDLADEADVAGLIAFFFACYGLGTPLHDDFAPLGQVVERAPAPFTSALPKRMLAKGALAVIGHVDRAWSVTFSWPGAPSDAGVFQSTISELLAGRTVGLALEYLNTLHGTVSSELARQLEDRAFGLKNDRAVAGLWLAKNDARNYTVLGDPAVRLSV
jgi:hypothetical protein